MIRLSIAIAMAAALLYSVTAQAQETKWLRMEEIPTPERSEMWAKRIDTRLCVVSLNMRGEVRAVLLRGVSKDLSKPWHIMEWKASNITALKAHSMELQNVYGNMVTGLEITSRDYFTDECRDLPPF